MDVEKELVSIIMPSYNSEKTIYEAIKSVLDQTYSNFELLVCDDGSNDNSKEIVSKFNDNRIILIDNELKKGAYGARATAIRYSTGDFIAFLDSDDLWHSDKLAIQISAMKELELDFTYTDYESFSDITGTNKIIISPQEVRYKDLLKCCNIGCLTVIIRRSAFLCIDYVDSPKEDYAYWLKLIKDCNVAYRVGGVLSYYRKSSLTLSSDKKNEIKKQWFVLRKIEKKPLILCTYYISFYVFNGIKKHYF